MRWDRIGRIVALCGFVALVAPGCNRNIETYDPDQEVEAPDLARIFRPEIDPVAEVAGAAGGPPPGGGRAGSSPTPDPSADAKPISGTVRLASDIPDGLPQGAVLFLIARHGEAGPPLAVVKVNAPSFPFDFEIGPGDRMIDTVPFAGPLRISARLDGDGNASTRAQGDLHGSAAEVAMPGSTDVLVTLDERI
jgi:hypothetical protein